MELSELSYEDALKKERENLRSKDRRKRSRRGGKNRHKVRDIEVLTKLIEDKKRVIAQSVRDLGGMVKKIESLVGRDGYDAKIKIRSLKRTLASIDGAWKKLPVIRAVDVVGEEGLNIDSLVDGIFKTMRR